MILKQAEPESLYPFDDLVEAGEGAAGGSWDPPGPVDKALDWLKEKLQPTYESAASDLEKRAAAAATQAAREAGPDIRRELEPVERSAKTMTYVLVGVGAVVVAATGVLIWQNTRRKKRR